jgi:polysaccharide pyruvyl transferase WcaK-like protein
MKTGILTYHRSHNYGAVLQAYALKTYISSLGYNVEFVDYWPQYHEDMYALWSWHKFWHLNISGKIKMTVSVCLKFHKKHKRRKLFFDFIDTYIVPKNSNEKEIYDLVIYGSDQIWRYQQHPSYKGYNEVYFGNDAVRAKRKIAFSASMGLIKSNEETVSFLKRVLKNFDARSVREIDLLNFIQPLTPLKVYHTLDPVFLLEKEQWENISAPRQMQGKYILAYNLQSNKTVEEIANYLSKQTKLPVIVLNGQVQFFTKNDKNISGPKEFISWIKYAEYVVSSSFHGVAFSIMFQKEFYISQNINSERVKSLLNMTGLTEQFITNIPNLEYIAPIDYNAVEQKLNSHKMLSENYLTAELGIQTNNE